MRVFSKIPLLFFLMFIFSSFGNQIIKGQSSTKTKSVRANNPVFSEKRKKKLVIASHQFALDVYSYLNTEKSGKNIFFSPYSLFIAMSMFYEGNGPTNNKVKSVFRVPKDDNIRRAVIANIYNELNNPKAGHKLLTANAVWLGKGVQPEMFNTIKKYYGAEVFITTPIKKINKWIAKKTMDIFKDVVKRAPPPGGISLINTIYFKGDWKYKFEKAKTREESFIISETQNVKVPMMNMTGTFNYMETETMQLLEMPYKGEELSILIFLPRDFAGKSKNKATGKQGASRAFKKLTSLDNASMASKGDLAALEKELTEANLTRWRKALSKKRKLRVYIPKFTFKKDYNLTQTLRPYSHPLIDKIIHEAFVDVNEEGTEAAAVTVITTKSMRQSLPPVFRADHPFIFLIQERETGQILFIGKFVSPDKK